MKRKITNVILIITFLLLIVSCVSGASSEMNIVRYTPLQNYPEWWTNKSRSTSKSLYFFSSSDRLSSPYLAKINAYEKILDDISEVIGSDIKERYMATFVSLSEIQELNVVVDEMIVYEYSSSSYECFVKVSCPTDILFTHGVVSREEFEKRRENITALRKKASEAYRNNRDYDALMLYIDACLIAENYTIFDGDDSFENLTKKAERIVRNSYLVLENSNHSPEGQTLVMKRNFGIIHPVIKGGVVETSSSSPRNDVSSATNSINSGNVNSVYTTDERGRFVYLSSLEGERSIGDIEFSLLLPHSISLFKTPRGEEFVSNLKKAREENKFVLSYSNEKRITEDNISVLISFYDENNAKIECENAKVSFINKIEETGEIKVLEQAIDDLDNDDSILPQATTITLEREFPSRFVITVIARVDEVSNIQTTGEKAVHIILDAVMADTNSKNVLFSSSTIDGVGYDRSENRATEIAFTGALDYLYNTLDDIIYN